MTDFFGLPSLFQSAILIMYTLIALAETYCIIACKTYKIKAYKIFLSLLLFIFSCTNLIVLTDGYTALSYGTEPSRISEKICSLPFALTGTLMLLQIFAICLTVYQLNIWRRTNITPMSIKQGADKLPTGICCCDENGRLKLTNYCMERLCRSITNEPLLNACEFWERLISGDVTAGNTVVKKGEEPIILLENGEVRCFARREIISGAKKTFEISAANITEQYALSRQLMAYNAELEEVKKRLVLFSENIADITREKEILAAKISIHNKLGNALLIARQYIENEDSAVSRESLLDIWQSCISLLRGESEQTEESGSFDELYNAASIMGVTLSVMGSLPAGDNRTMRFVISGARECLTNAVHHAKATKLNICISAENDYTIIKYTNNGIPPADKITEGGGLSSLRKSVESSGGIMQIFSVPQFALILKIPRWGGVDGD